MRYRLVLLALMLTVLALAAAPAALSALDRPARHPAATSQETPDPPTQVQVTLREFKIHVNPAKVPAGEITFTVTNKGREKHALAIKGADGTHSTPRLSRHQSTTLVVTLKPGKYVLYCPVDSHRKLGMKATLTVQ